MMFFTTLHKFMSKFGEITQARIHPPIQAIQRKFALVVDFPCFHPGEQGDGFIDGCDGIDMKLPGLHCINDILAQHEMADVGMWNHNPLITGKPFFPTDIKEAFNFLADTPDGLNLTVLIDRTGNGEVLSNRDPGQR